MGCGLAYSRVDKGLVPVVTAVEGQEENQHCKKRVLVEMEEVQ